MIFQLGISCLILTYRIQARDDLSLFACFTVYMYIYNTNLMKSPHQPKPYPFLGHCVLCLRPCRAISEVSFDSRLDLRSRYTCLTCF